MKAGPQTFFYTPRSPARSYVNSLSRLLTHCKAAAVIILWMGPSPFWYSNAKCLTTSSVKTPILSVPLPGTPRSQKQLCLHSREEPVALLRTSVVSANAASCSQSFPSQQMLPRSCGSAQPAGSTNRIRSMPLLASVLTANPASNRNLVPEKRYVSLRYEVRMSRFSKFQFNSFQLLECYDNWDWETWPPSSGPFWYCHARHCHTVRKLQIQCIIVIY